MKVNFNSLRKKIGQQYNVVCRTVRENLPEIDVDVRYDLVSSLDDLHDLIATLLCVESEEGEKFESVDFQLITVEGNEDDDE